MEKVLIPLMDNDLAPRFDLANEVMMISITRETSAMGRIEEKVEVLDTPSSEAMCRLAVAESVQTVICAGIEKEFYDFLEWKGIRVIDDICGPVDVILEAFLGGRLTPGQIYYRT
ncbi:dinitrogenase iron-molybdenum cofactor biosynthesis protein [Pseudodesulfovibrio sp. zrk46]|uniref:NifB/NifX family molybdenum-iron cluster-binding protein n=1 Tax=Pseudodesulfovibrio sp. zrk46 TaxID=2725288 RepID=UPI00144A041D|nr:dinitrogenase iron-molybdenum cofactor biosynthesis protein [Pseudodesulfovibrio sp. zrk46]QJB57271.1 dinitrogenase iron-molybdenum cofactor biosynthesis protein [Pseudodesulfovibrio sp. zrk46]